MTDDPHHSPRRKRDRTRQRLLEAARVRFREHGYESTTAAEIALDAGVTERTFFRYFPAKSDVLVAGWLEHQDALRKVLGGSADPDLGVTVLDALLAFADGVQAEMSEGIDSVIHLYMDRSAFLAITGVLLEVEHDLAAGIAVRSSRSPHDFAVRVVANASLGVMRAAIRAAVLAADGPSIVALVREGIGRLEPLFAELGETGQSGPAPTRR